MRTWHTLSPSPLPIRLGQTEVFHLALFVTVTPVFRPPAVPSAIGLPGDESRSAARAAASDARRAALAASANPVLKYLGRVVLPSEPGSGRDGLPAGAGGACLSLSASAGTASSSLCYVRPTP